MAASAISPRTFVVPKELLCAGLVLVPYLEYGTRTPIFASGLGVVLSKRRSRRISVLMFFKSGSRNTITSGALATVEPFALHRPRSQIFEFCCVRFDLCEQFGRTPIIAFFFAGCRIRLAKWSLCEQTLCARNFR